MQIGAVHPDRYSLTGVVTRKSGVIVHTTESSETSLEQHLIRMTKPGDRPWTRSDGSTSYYGSSYHAFADGSTGSYIQVQPASHGPFSAPPLNKTYWHICIPGWSKQTREQWLDATSYAQIRGVAAFIVDKSKIDGFPAVRLSHTELGNGGKGYAGHRDVTFGFKIYGGHTDPGPNFPWDILDAEVKKLLKPSLQPEEEDMARIVRLVDSAGNWVSPERFLLNGGQIEWISSPDRRNALIWDGQARLDAGGEPFKLQRDHLKWYRLAGELWSETTLSKTEFLQD